MQKLEPYYDALDDMIERSARSIVKTRANYPRERNYQAIRQLVYRGIVLSRMIEKGELADWPEPLPIIT